MGRSHRDDKTSSMETRPSFPPSTERSNQVGAFLKLFAVYRVFSFLIAPRVYASCVPRSDTVYLPPQFSAKNRCYKGSLCEVSMFLQGSCHHGGDYQAGENGCVVRACPNTR